MQNVRAGAPFVLEILAQRFNNTTNQWEARPLASLTPLTIQLTPPDGGTPLTPIAATLTTDGSDGLFQATIPATTTATAGVWEARGFGNGDPLGLPVRFKSVE